MSLLDHYRNQRAWRAFDLALDALPSLDGARILDLGCGVGDQAALLVARGARVVGVDSNEEVIAAASARGLAGAEFHVGDLRALPPFRAGFDGVWASFAAAYFVDLTPVLAGWCRALAPGGWVALTEIDDLFSHTPMSPRTRELFDGYVDDALAEGRYDFRMGRRLGAAGLTVESTFTLPDREFSFAGPAPDEVLRAWRERFELMRLLRVRFGAEYEAARDDFLACLARPDHVSQASVVFSVARRQGLRRRSTAEHGAAAARTTPDWPEARPV